MMDFQSVRKILRLPLYTMHLHKNRQYVMGNRRNFSNKVKEQKTECENARPKSCPSTSSSGKKGKKDSFWGGLFGSGKKKDEVKPPAESCTTERRTCHFKNAFVVKVQDIASPAKNNKK